METKIIRYAQNFKIDISNKDLAYNSFNLYLVKFGSKHMYQSTEI